MDVSIMELVRTLAAFDVGTKSDLAVAMEHVGNINEINDVLQHISLGSAKNHKLYKEINNASYVYENGNIVVSGFTRICNMSIPNFCIYPNFWIYTNNSCVYLSQYLVPKEINQVILCYLKQLNYPSLIPIIGNASAKGISKDEITNYLLYITKGAIANHIENVYLVFNEQEQINKVKDVVTVDLSKYNDEDSYLNDNYYAIW